MKSASTKQELFDMYVSPNLDYCRNVTLRYLSPDMDFEQTFSDIQTKLYKSMPYYDPNKPIKTFLHVCIKNYIYSQIKSLRKEKSIFVRLNNIINTQQPATHPNTGTFRASDFANTGRFAFSDMTYKAIMALKPIDRKIFLLHYIDNETIQEISQTIGIDAANIKQRLFQSMEIVKYKVTGTTPRHTSTYYYLSKSKVLNNKVIQS